MSVTVTELSPFERRLTFMFEGAPLHRAETRAARRVSRNVNINGFRRGKAPRRMVERIVGRDRIVGDAVEELLEAELPRALKEAGLLPAVRPMVDRIRDLREGVEVEITVSLWPRVEHPPHYEGRAFEVDAWVVDRSEVAVKSHIDRHRESFAELETVERASLRGDMVELDIHTSYDGRPLETFSITDLLHEIGTGGFLEDLDLNVEGCSAGDIVSFPTPLRFDTDGLVAGTLVEAHVLVKEVKEKRLPDLDDEWVSDSTEFDTVDELREDVTRRLEDAWLTNVRTQLMNEVMGRLTEEVEVDIPDAVIAAEKARLFDELVHDLEERGTPRDQYLRVIEEQREEFDEAMHSRAVHTIRTRVLLETIAGASGLEVDESELRMAYESAAGGLDVTPDELARNLAGSVQEMALMNDILRSKALDTLMQSVVAEDQDGNVLDLRFDPPEGTEIVEAQIERGDL